MDEREEVTRKLIESSCEKMYGRVSYLVRSLTSKERCENEGEMPATSCLCDMLDMRKGRATTTGSP